MRGVLVAIALVVALAWHLPTAQACSGTYGPSSDVHVVVTEGGTTLLDQPTGQTYAAHPCGSSPVGRPQFDGRYVAWHDKAGTMHAVDVETQEAVPGVPSGHLWNGAVHASEGVAVASFDLATGSITRHEAPTGTEFQGTANGVAWAVSTQPDPASPRDGFHLLDLEDGTWLMQGAQSSRWPEGDLIVRIANERWVVVAASGPTRESLWAVRVDSPQAPVRLPDGWPSSTGTQSPGSAGSVDALVGDRLYLTGWRDGNGGPSTWLTWSYLLPDASSPGGGLGDPTVGTRMAFFRLVAADTPTPTPTTHPTTATTTSDHTLTTGTQTSSGNPATSATTTAAAAGIATLVALVCALAAMRRRLH